ncbi:unnamed protein product [Protopolystoma xenopodis]|uniref:Carboxylesterase type B domain-containing protein n=1 Tax=Protopolystoma xenopodis TaxID=117903 RepID=A0A448WSH6_9PLAT|nr:unnamed protein product [Protopolystoma xenopodis]
MQGYEAEYVFGAPFNEAFQQQFYNFTPEERMLSEQVMRFWSNFAATGSPNQHPGEYHTRQRDLAWEHYQPMAQRRSRPNPVNPNRGVGVGDVPEFGTTTATGRADVGEGGQDSSQTVNPSPTGYRSLSPVPQLDPSRRHMVFDLPGGPRMEQNLRRHACTFWHERITYLHSLLSANSESALGTISHSLASTAKRRLCGRRHLLGEEEFGFEGAHGL